MANQKEMRYKVWRYWMLSKIGFYEILLFLLKWIALPKLWEEESVYEPPSNT